MRDGDQEALEAALRVICKLSPEAAGASFQTTDQDYVGFELTGIALTSGEQLADIAPSEFVKIAELVWPFVSSIGWDGVMGEDKQGSAVLNLGHRGMPKPGSIA